MRSLRCLGFMVVLAFLLGADDVSNNQGKIEGTKWSSVAATIKGVKLPAGTLELEFGKDGKLVYKVVNMNLTGKYTLGTGNKVTFIMDRELGGRKKHEETITIKGDKLTMSDSDGTTLDFINQDVNRDVDGKP